MGCSMKLERFCCCCSLKTGSLVIATVGWIGTLLKVFALVGAIPQQQPDHNLNSDENALVIAQIQSIQRSVLAVRIGYVVIVLIACILLVVGIYKKNNKFFIPWLVLQGLEGVGLILASLAIFVFIFILPHPANIAFLILFFIMSLVACLCWYFWLCVWSHYMELKEGQIMQPTSNVYYAPTTTNPPPYEKEKQPMV